MSKTKKTNPTKSEDVLYIVIPAYNEEANIGDVINEWYPIIEKYNDNKKSRLVIINDGSKDNTLATIKELAKTRPLLEVVDKQNSGHGSTVLYGYKYALDNGADYIFQTDSDGQTRPDEFHQFWDLRKDYDMIIGHRKGREDGFSRIVVTKTLKATVRVEFGVTVTDANTPFRLMNRAVLQDCIQYVPADFNLSNVVLTVIYHRKGQKIKYIPITFRPRQGGVNSINLKKIVGIGRNAFVDFHKINKSLKEAGF